MTMKSSRLDPALPTWLTITVMGPVLAPAGTVAMITVPSAEVACAE